MNNTELFFDRPWLLLLALPALGLILLPWLRISPKRRKSFRHIAALVLHSLAAVLLVLILARTAITRTTDSQAVVLVVDLSDSTQSVHPTIRENAAQLAQLIGKNAPVEVVVFANDCVYSHQWDDSLSPTRADASDLGAALEFAYSKLPDDRAGRIILLTDGKQTDGSAESAAQYLHSQGVRIDAVYYDIPLYTAEVQLADFIAPQTVYAGAQAELTVELQSNTYAKGTLTVYDNDVLLTTLEVETIVGTKPIPLTVQIDDTQPHTYRAVLECERDTLPQNNEVQVCVQVKDMPSVLLIAGNRPQSASLVQLLQQKNRVTVVDPEDAPKRLSEMCRYDGMILANVDADRLPWEYDRLLEQYVSQFGRSLLVLGGPNTLMYGNMQGTAFEEMLPVKMSLSRTGNEDPVAMMLVMDCSLSMSQDSTYMSLAKQGAIRCVEGMTDNDYVGVITFSRTATVEAELAKNTRERKDQLNRIVSGLTTAQGTYYTDALKLAHEQLLQSDIAIKHILFISDGSPADTEYRDLIPQIAQDGISITTIGLGYTSSTLETMANTTGGQYHYVTDATSLPDIMLTLTETMSINSLITGQFQPVVAEQTLLTDGLGAIPSLQGYLGTTLKQGAQEILTTQEKHPVYATWQYGAGKVSYFAGDLSADWCSQWLNSESGTSLIHAMVSHTLGDAHPSSTMTAQFTPYTKTAQLTVQTTDTEEYTLTATVGEKDYPMHRLEPGVYYTSFPTPSAGIYPVTVTQTDAQGTVIDILQTTLAMNWSTEYDAMASQGQPLVEAVCAFSGGMVTDDLQAHANVKMPSVAVIFDFTPIFSMLILGILLADIAIRKIRWKDLKNYWLILKNRKK